ncbi:M4 family metallopeptidase [Riemerella columbina]|uniref:M4 family metallopeptidase n=1 Tax=Riemerella columbina TaxID=103810 RepID=UPI00266ED359|nr:M4 family metallopeptidase [Riemerella columbina]WKS95224.1 M4 family metallopeptidase [Riemerella columbina]
MKRKLLLPPTVLFTAVLFFGQEAHQTNEQLGMFSKTLSFETTNAPDFVLGQLVLDESSKSLRDLPKLKLLQSEKDNVGITHYRYQQMLNGYPVEGASVVQHVKDDKVISQNGEIVKTFSNQLLSTKQPKISETKALDLAIAFMGAEAYKWEDPKEEEFLKAETGNPEATFKPEGTLVYYAPGAEFKPENLRLAYKFDIYAAKPLDRKIVYIDAENGSVLGTEDKIKHFCNNPLHLHGAEGEANVAALPESYMPNSTANGTAFTAYSGTRAIVTDYTGSTYRLRDNTRGNGIETYNLKRGTNYYNAVDFTDSDNNWNNRNTYLDQYATDAHWGSEMVYDFYKNTLNRNGIDNRGMKMLSYVHYGTNYVNAFWDGSRMTYGDGNYSYKPLVSLDIVGHEMTHGVTERSSGLAYRGESGALNEAYSDILGVAVDFWARPNQANWTMGEEIGAAFRSMINPNQYSQPDTYKGTKWVSTEGCVPSRSNDQCGVHTNSGVLNYWFYLLVNGGRGTNDLGNTFNVSGIGITKATAIAYRTNVYYLTSSSNYADARTYSIKSAEDLYGANSNEVKQVKNAFHAVGIGSAAGDTPTTPPTACNTPTGLVSTNITSSGAKLLWDAVSGATGYTVEYKAATDYSYSASDVQSAGAILSGLDSGTTYNWRVKTKCNSSTSNYASAQFTTTSSSSGCNGAFEPNNSTGTATEITALNADYNASIETSYDVDYYKVSFSSGGTLTVKLTGLTHDVDLALYNSSGYRVVSSQKSGTADEKLYYRASAGTYYIKVYPYSGSNPNACYTLRIEPGYTIAGNAGVVAEEANSDGGYSVYPNPATDVINIKVPEKLVANTTVHIYDLSGKKVITTGIEGKGQINISRLPKGVYTAKVDTGDGESTVLKFIKK